MSTQLLQAFEVVQISVGFRVIANMEIDQMSTNVGRYATLWRSAEARARQIGRGLSAAQETEKFFICRDILFVLFSSCPSAVQMCMRL
jgi:hypothetical protein